MSQISKNLVKIFDVTLRDGIQNLKTTSSKPIFTSGMKLQIMNRLIGANVKQVEFGSNVSLKITEMANTKDVVDSFDVYKPEPDVKLCLLVPNYKKYVETFKWKNSQHINNYSLITACSEGFIKKNTQMTFNQNLEEIDKILHDTNNKFRLYVSCCFGCPIEGQTTSTHLDNLKTIVNKYSSNVNINEIVLSDTIGSYNMNQLDEYMRLYKSSKKISLHIHSDEHDKNIPSIVENYMFDIVSIDTSMGNIGGCPSVEKAKVKPNLSTLKVAEIINGLENKQIYNLKEIAILESLVKDIIRSQLDNPPHL